MFLCGMLGKLFADMTVCFLVFKNSDFSFDFVEGRSDMWAGQRRGRSIGRAGRRDGVWTGFQLGEAETLLYYPDSGYGVYSELHF